MTGAAQTQRRRLEFARCAPDRLSGCAIALFEQESRDRRQLFDFRLVGKEVHFVAGIIGGRLAVIADDYDVQRRQPVLELVNEGGTAESSRMMARDYQTEFAGEAGLFDHAERFGGIGNPLHIVKVPLQGRLEEGGLKGFVVH
jgi:hypothetical protein